MKKFIKMKIICDKKSNIMKWLGLIILTIIISLVLYLGFIIMYYPKVPKTVKSKRFAELSKKFPKNVQISSGMLNNSEENLEIIPETERKFENRRNGRHPNHRYSDMEPESVIYEKMMRDLYFRNGWSPKRFESKKEITLNNIQDVISKTKTNDHNINEKHQTLPSPIDVKLLTSPMRLKGVYILPRKAENELTDQSTEYSDNYNLKKINDLMQSNSSKFFPEDKWSRNKGFKNGSPFRLSSKVTKTPQIYETSHSFKNYWTNPERKQKNKSITILLDVYPMTDKMGDNYRVFNTKNKDLIYGHYKPKDGILKPAASFLANHPGKFFPYEGEKKRILMKLNFHPKKRQQQQPKITELDVIEINKADRRTFSLFKKPKKPKHTKECTVIGYSPIKAKWKDEEGNWVYADRLKFKHYKDEEE